MFKRSAALYAAVFAALIFRFASGADVTVTLTSNGVTGSQVVSFGLPIPPGQVADAGRIAVFEGSAELPAYAEPLVPWRAWNTAGIRSALVQFPMSFTSGTATPSKLQIPNNGQDSSEVSSTATYKVSAPSNATVRPVNGDIVIVS